MQVLLDVTQFDWKNCYIRFEKLQLEGVQDK